MTLSEIFFKLKGTAKWFDSIGIKKNVHELNWWESKTYKNLEFVFTPSQHWCGRSAFDRNNVGFLVSLIKKIFKKI